MKDKISICNILISLLAILLHMAISLDFAPIEIFTIISVIFLLFAIKSKSKYQIQLIIAFGIISGVLSKICLVYNGIGPFNYF